MSNPEIARLRENCPNCGRADYRWIGEVRFNTTTAPFYEMKRRCDYCRPLRMDAYYFGFTPTGVEAIDRILSAVAHAGKGYHHTESWSDDGVEDWGEFRGGSYAAWIQNAATAAAKALASTPPASAPEPSVCPHCELPPVMPEVCTPELHEVIERNLARDWSTFNDGWDAGKRAASEPSVCVWTEGTGEWSRNSWWPGCRESKSGVTYTTSIVRTFHHCPDCGKPLSLTSEAT